jgi:hypothetical protein
VRASAAWACDDDLVAARSLAVALGRAKGGGLRGGGGGGDKSGRGGASDGEAEAPSAPAAGAEATRMRCDVAAATRKHSGVWVSTFLCLVCACRHRHGVFGPDSVLSVSDAHALLVR